MKQEERNWLDLPSDLTFNILNRIGMVDILEHAQKVCTAWRKICKDPVMWRVIDMNEVSRLEAESICKRAVDRSQGQLVDITLINDYDAQLLLYVADRSSHLRRLEMVYSLFFGSLTEDHLMKFPLLEEVNFYFVGISKEVIKTLGSYCLMLKTLKVNEKPNRSHVYDDTDEIAIAIEQNLVELRHLELVGNRMTNIGLQAILDNCHQLQTLDLRACFNIALNGDLEKKCFEQIKYLKFPKDSLQGCPYICETDSDATDEYGSDDRLDEDCYNFRSYDERRDDRPYMDSYSYNYRDNCDGYDSFDVYDYHFQID
ncbi:hypothetical protein QVD17_36094 [Tagetes erecta]|uniref:F-box domain-containing protein n=1 Tax=Tagetes erecta TaxID=13708 RepID=A0AAD8JS14_TARER|nr:hypothetical protein QVD17_36094 [Tagetes erecta]